MNNKGYVALSSVLVIAVIVLILGSTVALLSINTIQSSLASKKGAEVLDIVEGCAEDALLTLNETNNVPSTITLPEGTCDVSIISQLGTDWLFTISATNEGYTKSIRIDASRTSTVTINSWTEQ